MNIRYRVDLRHTQLAALLNGGKQAARKIKRAPILLATATACSSPHNGRRRWILDLLAGAMVRLTEHDALSRETVRQRLAECALKPWRRDMWCIPPLDGSYVRGWRTCLISMPKWLIRSADWFALIRARHS